MAAQDKLITDLNLIADITNDVNFPVDNGTQSYRATAAQMKAWILAANNVDTTQIKDGAVTLAKLAAAVAEMLVPTATIHALYDTTIPAGYLLCDGSEVSRTTYAALYAKISARVGPGNGTTTFNLPDLRGYFLRGLAPLKSITGTGTVATNNATFTGHGLKTGEPMLFSSGALSGLTVGGVYFVIVIDANTLAFATTPTLAFAGSKIAITGANSAVMTQGKDPETGQREAQASGLTAGAVIGSIQQDQFKSHTHFRGVVATANGNGGSPGSSFAQGPSDTAAAGGFESRPKNMAVNFIIKT